MKVALLSILLGYACLTLVLTRPAAADQVSPIRPATTDGGGRQPLVDGELRLIGTRSPEFAEPAAGLSEPNFALDVLRRRLAETESRVRDLEAMVSRLVDQPGALRQVTAVPYGRRTQPDWYAVGAFCAEYDADAEVAERAVRFMTAAELLLRFGAPTRMGEDDGEDRWIYQDGTRGVRVVFALRGDRVRRVRVLGRRA